MTRRKFPRGLTKTPTGWRITVCVDKRTYQKRLKASVTQEKAEEALRATRLHVRAGKSRQPTGMLGADITRYLDHYFGQRAGREERERHLRLWIGALGADTWRSTIGREDVSRVLHGWKSAGLSADTCNKRRAAFLAFFNTLDGKDGKNPVRDVPKFRVAALQPRGLTYPQIAKAMIRLPECKTRARLKVMAYTGARPIQVRRLKPEDWNKADATLLLQSTEKGQGTKPHRVPLSEKAQAAMVEFNRVDAWGTFSSAPMGRMWKAAVLAAGIPSETRPYDLRHSFGTEIYRRTGDIRVTKELMGHSTLAMTERYTLGAIPERSRAAVQAFDASVNLPDD